MRPTDLILHCYFEKDGDQWLAFCLDFSLVAQAETLEEAHHKLEEQMVSYVTDATTGEDRAYGSQLLTRRAPLRYWLKFYVVRFRQWRRHAGSLKRKRAVLEPMPMAPAICH